MHLYKQTLCNDYFATDLQIHNKMCFILHWCGLELKRSISLGNYKVYLRPETKNNYPIPWVHEGEHQFSSIFIIYIDSLLQEYLFEMIEPSSDGQTFMFASSLRTRYIRVFPKMLLQTLYTPACLKLEVIGCQIKGKI